RGRDGGRVGGARRHGADLRPRARAHGGVRGGRRRAGRRAGPPHRRRPVARGAGADGARVGVGGGGRVGGRRRAGRRRVVPGCEPGGRRRDRGGRRRGGAARVPGARRVRVAQPPVRDASSGGRRGGAGVRARRTAALAMAALALAGAGGTGCAERARDLEAAPVRRVLVVSLPGVDWDRLRGADLPNLERFVEQAAVADLTTRIGRRSAGATDAYLTMGAGTRAVAPDVDTAVAVEPDETYGGVP